jgi:WD40 repeat protein
MHQSYRSFLRAWLLLLAAVSPLASADPPKPAPRLDLYGDPLPPEAVVRLGTVRLRNTEAGVFLPDGKRLATCGHGQVHLFDVATGKEAAGFPKKGGNWVKIAVSPKGALLAALDRDTRLYPYTRTVVVWELPSGKESRRLEMPARAGYSACEFGLVFSSDGKVLTAANGGSTCSWNLGSGKRFRDFKYIHKNDIESIPPLPPNVRIRRDPRRDGRILFTTFSPGGKYLAVGVSGKAIAVWDVVAGKLLRRLDSYGGVFKGSAAFSGDGKILVTGGDLTGAVHLWDVATGKELRQLPTEQLPIEFECSITGVAISPDSKQVAAAARVRWSLGFGLGVKPKEGRLVVKPKETLYFWDLGAKSDAPRILPAPDVSWVQYSPDSKTLAWGYDDESVCLIDRKSGKEITVLNAHRNNITSVAYSPDGKRLATASRDHTVRVWEAATGKPLLTLAGQTSYNAAVTFSPDGRWLASPGIDGTAVLWDVSTGAKKRTLKHESWLAAIAFSPDGRALATLDGEGTVRLWDLATGKVKRRLAGAASWWDAPGVFSPDWRFLADCDADSVRLRNLATGKVVQQFKVGPEWRAVAFSSDGRTLAVATKHKVILWELVTCGERVVFSVELVGHPSSLVFSPDGTLLAFCESRVLAGGQVRVWDLAARKEFSGIASGAERVSAIAFSPDGKNLATASDDTTVLIWDLCRYRRR